MQGWLRQCSGGKASHLSVFQAGCLQKPQVCRIGGQIWWALDAKACNYHIMRENHTLAKRKNWPGEAKVSIMTGTYFLCLCQMSFSLSLSQMCQKLKTVKLNWRSKWYVTVVSKLCLCHCVFLCNCICLCLFPLVMYCLWHCQMSISLSLLLSFYWSSLWSNVSKVKSLPWEANGSSSVWEWGHLLPLV